MKKNVILIIGGIALLGWIYIAIELLTPLPVGSSYVEVKIPEGTTFRQAIEILSKEGLVRDKNLLIFIARTSGLDRKIRAGYYSFAGSLNPINILGMLRNGKIVEYEIKILEGDSLWEIAKKLSKTGIISEKDFCDLSKDKKFLGAYDIEATTLEGYTFPDTYKIPKGMHPNDAIGMMINRMREKFSSDLRARAKKLGLSEKQVLTLASVIEKEAIVDEERPLISAVYHNRLKKGMRLQADPTAIYGVKNSNQRITARDVRRKTPYNTYIIKGLPPGPIASPGIKSIIAALYPADVPYLYFVSNAYGRHHFSVTVKEHVAAIELYKKNKRLKIKTDKNKETTKKDDSS
ncbi:MAG: endolytic transglycosylase MltG [Nitrospirota bacterium]